MPQYNLFSELICDYCNTNPGSKPHSKALWNGFLDEDTGQHVCFRCRDEHYAQKADGLSVSKDTASSEKNVTITTNP